MKNLIAALLTLCMVWSVVPETTTVTVPDGDEGIRTCEYFIHDQYNWLIYGTFDNMPLVIYQ